MIATLRRSLVSLRNRVCHSGVVVLSGSSLNPKAVVDRGVKIGRNCVILKARLSGRSQIDDRVLICDGVMLHSTNVGADCRIEAGASLAGTVLESCVAVHRDVEVCDANVGKYSYIARDTIISEVHIGRYSSIGPRCLLGSGEHPIDRVSTSPAFYSNLNQAGGSFAESEENRRWARRVDRGSRFCA
jgi:UDP-3-O-[3-hydroxymyristoyl] glucosamine N-acyltransferase